MSDSSRLLQIFQCGKKAFSDIIQNLSHSQVDDLVNGLRQNVSDAETCVLYCKMLFAHERTREMGILLCIDLVQNETFSERAAFRCIPEIKTAIRDCAWLGQELRNAEPAVAAQLSVICDKIIGFLRCASRPNTIVGYVQALDLLPTVMQCLENIVVEITPYCQQKHASDRELSQQADQHSIAVPEAAAIRKAIMSDLFEAAWPGDVVLPLQIVLADICLTSSEQALLSGKITEGLVRVPEKHIIGLIQASFAAAEKSGDMRWLDTGRHVLEKTPEHLLGDAYCVVEMSLQSGSRLMGLLLRSFASLIFTDESLAKSQSKSKESAKNGEASMRHSNRHASYPLRVSDFNLMLVVAQNDIFKDVVMDSLISALQMASNSSPEPHLQACESLTESGVLHTTRMLSEVVKGREAGRYTCTLLELGLCLLHDASHVKASNRKKHLHVLEGLESNRGGLGQHLLCELFQWQPHVRGELLSTIFDSLVEHLHSPRFVSSCVQVLQRIASWHLLSLRDEAARIAQCLSLLWLLPLNVSRDLLCAFLPLTRYSDSLSDRLLLLFRKELYGTEVSRRCLAIHGVCLMLLHGALREQQQQVDLIILLKPLLSSDSAIRIEVYDRLHELLMFCQNSRNRGDGIHPEALTLIRQLLISRIKRCAVDKDDLQGHGKGQAGHHSRAALRIECCFELVGLGDSTQLRCRENLQGLVMCLIAMCNLDDEACNMVSALSLQLSSPHHIADLILGDVKVQGEDDSGQEPRVQLKAADRISILLSLYEMLIDECTLDATPKWAASLDKTWGSLAARHVWTCIYSTISILLPSMPSALSGLQTGLVQSSACPEKALRALEQMCDRHDGASCEDDKVDSKQWMQQSPVLCRLIMRILESSDEHGLSFRTQRMTISEEQPMASSSSAGQSNRTAAQNATELKVADFWPRFLSCLVPLYVRTNQAPNMPSQVTQPTTRASVLAESQRQKLDSREMARASASEDGSAESSGDSNVALFEKQFDECLKERNDSIQLGTKPSLNITLYHEMRILLLRAMKVCLSKGCMPEHLLGGIAQTGRRQGPRAGEWEGLDPHEQDSSIGDSSSWRSARAPSPGVACVQSLCRFLKSEVEDGIPLATLTQYLDLIQVIHDAEQGADRVSGSVTDSVRQIRCEDVDVHSDGAWGSIARSMFELFGEFDIYNAQILRRILSLSLKALHPLRSALLCAHVLSHVYSCAATNDSHMVSIDSELETTSTQATLPEIDWELPDLKNASTRCSASIVCLRHLCWYFSNRARTFSGDMQLHIRVCTNIASVITVINNSAGESSSSVRSLLVRLCKRMLSHSCDLMTYSSEHEKRKKMAHLILLHLRQALIASHALYEDVCEGSDTAGMAQVRHAVHKCRTVVASFSRSFASAGVLAELAKEVDHHIKLVIEQDGCVDIALDSVSSRIPGKSARKRRRLRSRNAYVDAGLAEEDGDDDYGDLEDFIVCREGTSY